MFASISPLLQVILDQGRSITAKPLLNYIRCQVEEEGAISFLLKYQWQFSVIASQCCVQELALISASSVANSS